MFWTDLGFNFIGMCESIGYKDSIGFIGWFFFGEDVVLWI